MLTQTVLRTIQENNLLYPNEIALIAVSGGIDSIALLHILAKLQSQLQIDLQAATFDHQLRQGSKHDVELVIEICSRLDIPLHTGQSDVQAYADQENLSLETAARLSRYRFLAKTALSIHASTVITAHHADDQAETIVMNLIRGTGLRGLGGMKMRAPLPTQPALSLIRPMLKITRKVIIDYCESNQLVWRNDPSNESTDYFRNRVRLSILPQLTDENPNIVTGLNQLADILQHDEAYLEELTETFIVKNVNFAKSGVKIPQVALANLHIALLRRVLRQCIEIGFPEVEPQFHHINHAVDLVQKNAHGKVAELTNDVILRLEYGMVYIEYADATHGDMEDWLLMPNDAVIDVRIPGKTELINNIWRLSCTFEASAHEPNAELMIAPESTVYLRTRKPGDQIQPLGMSGKHQTIKAWMINNKIPAHIRGQIPLLIVNDTIAAVVLRGHWVINEQFAVKNEHQRSLKFFVNCS